MEKMTENHQRPEMGGRMVPNSQNALKQQILTKF